MDLELSNKVVIVTGGSKGIGEAIVRSLAAEGAVPVIVGRSPEQGNAVAAELRENGLEADYIQAELRDEEAAAAAVKSTLEKRGRIDGLVNKGDGKNQLTFVE